MLADADLGGHGPPYLDMQTYLRDGTLASPIDDEGPLSLRVDSTRQRDVCQFVERLCPQVVR